MTKLIQSAISLHASLRPGAIAVAYKDQTLTYAELDALSNQLARALKASGCQRGDRVCLLMPKSPMAIVGIVAIYKADCIYVPLDPSNPQERLNKVFQSSMSRCVLGSIATVNQVRNLSANTIVNSPIVTGWVDTTFPYKNCSGPEFSLADVFGYSDAPIEYSNCINDAAHILFTSGSTGEPKGVVITHNNVCSFVDWATRYFAMNSADRVSGHTPLCFDLSIFDIFAAFAVGAELHLTPPEIALIPHKLAEWISATRLTQWFSVPSVMNYLAKFDALKADAYPYLKRVLWCGEVLPVPTLIYWMKKLPHVQYTNLYGPTETTIASSYYTLTECPDDRQLSIPIGRACAGEELLVLDKELRPVAAEQVGDLYIRGAGLSRGYWQDQDKTSAVFIQNPYSTCPLDRIYKTGDLASQGKDGLFYFIGRDDTQIKSRGYRIELGEIESALYTISELRECAVVVVQTENFEGTTICCAYVPIDINSITSARIREKLAGLIPAYMLPSQWQPYKVLPKNVSGKIDRNKLKADFSNRMADSLPELPANLRAM